MTLLYIVIGLVSLLWIIDNYFVDLGFLMPVLKELGKLTFMLMAVFGAIAVLFWGSVKIWGEDTVANKILTPMSVFSAVADTVDGRQDMARGPQWAKAQGWYAQNCSWGDSVNVDIQKEETFVNCISDSLMNVYFNDKKVGSMEDPIIMDDDEIPGPVWVSWGIENSMVQARYILWAWLRS